MSERRKAKHVVRRISDADKAKYFAIGKAIEKEFPPGSFVHPSGDPNLPASLGDYFDLRALVWQLRKAREAQGLSLADIQQATGIDRSALSRFENSQNQNPTVNTLMRYAMAVGRHIKMSLVKAHPSGPRSRRTKRVRG